MSLLSLLSSLLLLAEKSPYLEVQAPERLVSTMNQSNWTKNGFQCVSHRGIWSTSVTNSAFLLAFLSTVPTQCIMHAGLVLSAHAHKIEYYALVKVVNNANGTRLAAATKIKADLDNCAMCARGMCSIEL